MPCYSLQTNSVDLGLALKRPEILRNAIMSLEGATNVTLQQDGSLTFQLNDRWMSIAGGELTETARRGKQQDLPAIRRQITDAYGIETARSVARQQGWGFKKTGQRTFQFSR